MKKTIKMNEQELRQMISESVKKILNEGHWNQDIYNEWCDLRETIGDDGFISELYNWMGADVIEGFIKHIKRNYNIGYNDEEGYEEYGDMNNQ